MYAHNVGDQMEHGKIAFLMFYRLHFINFEVPENVRNNTYLWIAFIFLLVSVSAAHLR